jgi:rare lipoprotein A
MTANGEVFDPNGLNAAHKHLPLPTHVRVTNLENRRSIVLRVNDRGPFVRGRIIDLSSRAPPRDWAFTGRGRPGFL